MAYLLPDLIEGTCARSRDYEQHSEDDKNSGDHVRSGGDSREAVQLVAGVLVEECRLVQPDDRNYRVGEILEHAKA